MRISVIICSLTICLGLAGCKDKGAGISDRDRSKAIQDLGQSILAQRGVPGIAIGIVRDGKPFQTLTIGYSNLSTHESVSSKTPFQLASTTKIFCSAGILLLVADGKLHLDDSIGSFLEGLPPSWRMLTIRQLLSHTSGLPDITRTSGQLDLVADNWESALQLTSSKPFQFQPGHGWAYTQTNYALLQQLIERISGTTFEKFLQDRLFQPLSMRNTFFPGPQRSCATNYERSREGQIVERDLSFPHYVHAAGGLCSSLDDLLTWNAALDSGRIIPLDLMKVAWAPTKLQDGSNAKIAGPLSYGLGWAIDTTPGHYWAGHSGGNSSAFRRYFDNKLTVIVLHNGASDPDAIATSLADLMIKTTAKGDPQANLWDAADNGDQTAAEMALKAGADVNKLDTRSSPNGRYALNWAAFHNHPEMIKFLLAHGAGIDARNLTGFTALHHAAEGGSAAAAEALIEAGANPSLRNSTGETASDVARRKGYEAVAQIIDKSSPKK